MDQGCIAAMKKKYKTALLRELLSKDTSGNKITVFLKKWSLYDSYILATQAWNELSVETLRNAWNKLLKEYHESTTSNSVPVLQSNSEVLGLLDKLQGDNIYSLQDVDECQKKRFTGGSDLFE